MEQKHALVTGASEGIGREFAVQLAAKGYSITALARNRARLKDLVAGLGQGHKVLVADLGERAGIDAAVGELKSRHYDLLVNNAGIGVAGRFDQTPMERLQPMLDLNIGALTELSHAFLGQSQAGDALINLSSGLAFLPMPSMGLYAATKAFVTSFSESLWFEQRSRGVYVMGLCPGITRTQFNLRSGGEEETKAPKAMVQTADQVVAKALRELEARRHPTVLSGLLNSVFAFSTRLRSRKAVVSQMGQMAV